MFLKLLKITSLCTVPFVSSYFVSPDNDFVNKRSFFNTQVVHQLLVDNGFAIQSRIYNAKERLQIYDRLNPKKNIFEKSPKEIQDYLRARYPKNETFIENFKKYTASCGFANLARIPVEKGRVHDATLMLAPGNTLSSPTVVLYHGNAGSRSGMRLEAAEFCNKGYNALLSSYAGDRVLGDRVKDNIVCTELSMRQDAEADLQFLKDLNVRSIGIYGMSLGGSQAVNLADVIDIHNSQHPQETIGVSLLFLDKTFTSATAVSGRFVENMTGSTLLGTYISAITAEHLKLEQCASSSPYCDGLDSKKKLQRFKTSDTFKNTHLILVGVSHDEYMGGKNNSEYDAANNMVFELQEAASGGCFKIIHLAFIESETEPHHNTPFYSCTNKEAIIAMIPSK